MNISERQENFINDMAALGDWFTRFTYLMELAAKAEPMDESLKNDTTLLKSCQSKSWMHVSFDNDILNIKIDSEALISKGILAIYPYLLNGATKEEIKGSKLTFLEATGLDSQIETQRKLGLLEAEKRIREAALK